MGRSWRYSQNEFYKKDIDKEYALTMISDSSTPHSFVVWYSTKKYEGQRNLQRK